MCGAPTSGAEPPGAKSSGAAEGKAPDAETLARAGWSDAELTWEHVQEAAAEALEAGNWAAASDLWETGLAIARDTFGENDPRLATSLANHAVGCREARDNISAEELLVEAIEVWDRSGPWVDALAPERRARSATYHLRLETRYPGGYDRHSRARYVALAEEGRTAIQVLKDKRSGVAHPEPRGSLGRWRKERPAELTDSRKLLAAVLLIAEPSA